MKRIRFDQIFRPIIASFGDFKFNSVFFHFFRLVALVLVIPMLLMTSLYFWFSISTLDQEFLNANTSQIRQIVNVVDSLIVKDNEIALGLTQMEDVIYMAGNSRVDQWLGYPGILRGAQQRLDLIKIVSKEINDMLIYLYDSDYVIASDSAFAKQTLSPMRPFSPSLFIKAASLDALPRFQFDSAGLFLIQPITRLSALKGVIISQLNLHYLARQLGDMIKDSDKALYLLNQDNQVILTVAGSNMPRFAELPAELVGLDPGTEDTGFVKIQNVSYAMSKLSSTNVEVKALLLASTSQYNKNRRQMSLVVVLLIIGSILLTLVISWLIAHRFYRPVSVLVRLITHPVDSYEDIHPQDVAALDEFKYISQEIKEKRWENRIIRSELEQRKNMLREAQYAALLAQINPHFISNSLESINSRALIKFKGPNEVSEMILDLARLLRLSLSSQNSIVPLKKEIEHAKLYLKFQQYRFEYGFDVDWQIDPETLELMTLRLSLQPVLENALQHGLASKQARGRIHIQSELLADHLVRISVTDNGTGIPPEKLQALQQELVSPVLPDDRHIGLENVHQRIRLIFGDEFGLTIDSRQGEWTKVVLTIPKVD